MFLLFESAAGLAIFKVKNESKLSDPSAIDQMSNSYAGISNLIKLKCFKKFKDMEQALKTIKRFADGKVSKKLKQIINSCEEVQNSKLAVSELKIGNALQEKFNISCVTSPAIQELMRGIREHINDLIPGELESSQLRNMSVGLAHSYSRFKLKFNPDRIDTMIIQGINLLDDLDKEINNYVMRCREWYGWHFPELAKIVPDNITYIKILREIGFKTNTELSNLTGLVDETLEKEIKVAASFSMGTDITEEDMQKILILCDQIIEMSDYRASLTEYITNRMQLVAPNLSILVGELIGARLISHAGSLLNLSKQPSSTVQVFGAEKALFNALKFNKNTPKYGLIYHASLVSQAPADLKGKMSRTLAAKCALAIRCDALSEQELSTNHTIKMKAQLEQKLMGMENLLNHQSAGKFNTSFKKTPSMSGIRSYNPSIDYYLASEKRKASVQDDENINTSTIFEDNNLSQKKKKKSEKQS